MRGAVSAAMIEGWEDGQREGRRWRGECRSQLLDVAVSIMAVAGHWRWRRRPAAASSTAGASTATGE